MSEVQESSITNPLSKGLTDLMKNENEILVFQNFRSTSANAIHPGFSHESTYDGQRAVLRPLPSKLLSSTLAESLKNSDLVADLQYKPQECGWEDVLGCIETAKGLYDAKGENSRLRKWARHADTTAGVLKSLAGMIPDEKGLSVLREGLVFLFQAWQRHMKNREDVLQQLEDVPLLLSAATERWKLYPHEERLRAAAQNLCHTVVDSITVLITVLLRTQKGSFITKYRHRIPDIETQYIEDACKSIECSKAALDTCMERLSEEQIASSSKVSTKILSEVSAVRKTEHEHHGIMMRALASIAAGPREVVMTESQVEDAFEKIVKKVFQEMAAMDAQTGLYRLVEDNEYSRRLGFYRYDENTFQSNTLETATMVTSKAEVIQHLRLSKIGSVEEDVEIIRRQGTNVAAEGLGHARRLMAMTRFGEWLGNDDSKLLLVDGHCQTWGHGKTSPLSVFCASLASTLAQSESLVILQYFCGHNAMDSNSLPGGPLGLIKSLLVQLLHQLDDVLPHNIQLEKRLYDRADHDDVDHLCEIFGMLFSQINPSKITICILDDISEFEGARGGWVNGMCLVADQLRHMVHHFKGPQKLKVLMTSANKSTMVSPRLLEEEKVSLRGYGLPNHSSGRLVISNSDLSLPRVPSQGSSSYEGQ